MFKVFNKKVGNEMLEVNQITSIKDIDFNTLKHSYHAYLENELYQVDSNGVDMNTAYFQSVYNKAIAIFDEIFDLKDHIKMIHSISTNLVMPRRTRFSKKFLSKKVVSSYKYEQIIGYNDIFEIANVFTYQCKKGDIKYQKLIKAICNQDFPSLIPNMNQGETYSSIYFINVDKGILFHLYDDRGFIVAFSHTDDFEAFKQNHDELEFQVYTEDEI